MKDSDMARTLLIGLVAGAVVVLMLCIPMMTLNAKPSESYKQHNATLDDVYCKRIIICDDPRDGGKKAKYKCVIQAEPDNHITGKGGGIYLWMLQPDGEPAVGMYNSKDQGAVMGLWSTMPPKTAKGYIGMDFCINTQGEGVNVQSVSGKNVKKIKILDAKDLLFNKEEK